MTKIKRIIHCKINDDTINLILTFRILIPSKIFTSIFQNKLNSLRVIAILITSGNGEKIPATY